MHGCWCPHRLGQHRSGACGALHARLNNQRRLHQAVSWLQAALLTVHAQRQPRSSGFRTECRSQVCVHDVSRRRWLRPPPSHVLPRQRAPASSSVITCVRWSRSGAAASGRHYASNMEQALTVNRPGRCLPGAVRNTRSRHAVVTRNRPCGHAVHAAARPSACHLHGDRRHTRGWLDGAASGQSSAEQADWGRGGLKKARPQSRRAAGPPEASNTPPWCASRD